MPKQETGFSSDFAFRNEHLVLSCLTDRFACDLLSCRSQERRHTLDTVRQGGFRPTDRPTSGQAERTVVDKVSGSSCCHKIKPQLFRNCKLCLPPYLDFGRLIKLCKICDYRGCLFGFIFNLTHAETLLCFWEGASDLVLISLYANCSI